MPDYSKGKIYKILNSIDDEIYVGSTIKTLSQRMAHHRHSLKQLPHIKLYTHMIELGIEHFYIELIENFPCNDVYELRAREGHVIREIGTLNKNIAGRTYNKWREENKEHIKEVKKQYYEYNKESIRQHYESNKDYLKEYDKQYHEQNKEHIHQRKNERITCNVCGCHINKSSISKHQKTKKCKSYVKPIENEE